ncbi:hypothetical protein [Georgenia soli]|uniref:hypothetical protein n=1 Tax=Georgenia soli TaxID=638953 RepID=UPI000BF94015|nr:hypothetical protein [Georgenia soli]
MAGCGAGDKANVGRGEEELGPLGEFYERAYGSFDDDQADRDMMRVEEVTAECMAEQGFEYEPVDWNSQGGVSYSDEDLDVEWGSREFAETYGYGIANDPFAELHESAPPPEQEFVDPNQKYVEAMSPAEQEAYYLALYGDQQFPEDGSEEEFEYDWKQNGCQGKAQYEVYESRMDNPEFASLEEEMNSLWERTQQDPRMTEATTAWIDCMGDAGHTGLAAVDDAQNQFSEKVNAVYEDAYPSDMGEEMTEEDFRAIDAGIQEKLAGLKEEEIATAVADFDCREEAKVDETRKKVSFELEQDFVDTHRDELEAWVEAISARNS